MEVQCADVGAALLRERASQVADSERVAASSDRLARFSSRRDVLRAKRILLSKKTFATARRGG